MSNINFDIDNIIATAKQVVTDPAGFYKSMPVTGGYQTPIIFAATMAVVTAAVLFVLAIVGLGALHIMGMGAVMMLVVYPIAVVIGSFIMGGILYVIWKLMGSNKDYETSVRCFAYSTAVLPIVAAATILPVIGEIASPLWGCLLMYFASMHVHALEEKNSKIVFGVLAAILVLGALSR
jgi:hypothetical protein